MRLDNGTSDPVDYEQTGGGPLPQDAEVSSGSRAGSLAASGQKGDQTTFAASGSAPYMVSFVSQDTPQSATSCPFSDGEATVTLNSDWTISVSSGCD